MKNTLIFISILSIFMIWGCDVDQTRETKLPEIDVDVDAKSGQLPSFDIDWADVDVKTRTEIVKVPKVRVVMEEEEIEVPYIDVDMPTDKDKEERSIIVEAEVAGSVYDLDIVEVYATNKRLIVISELKTTDEDLGDEVMRVSDRLVLNAPDLDVKHYVIGTRPSGDFNRQFSYISNKNAIASKLKGAKQIYKD